MRACAYEAVHSVFVPHGHKIVQQGVDGGAEVEEHRGHEVEILSQEEVEQLVGIVVVRLVQSDVQMVQCHSVHGDAGSGERMMRAVL